MPWPRKHWALGQNEQTSSMFRLLFFPVWAEWVGQLLRGCKSNSHFSPEPEYCRLNWHYDSLERTVREQPSLRIRDSVRFRSLRRGKSGASFAVRLKKKRRKKWAISVHFSEHFHERLWELASAVLNLNFSSFSGSEKRKISGHLANFIAS